MGLLSKFRKGAAAPERSQPAAASVDGDVQQARVRARRRLIGAALLLGAGVVAFPLVFETQPRPVPVNVVLDIPDAGKAEPLVLPPPAKTPSTGTSPAPTLPSAPAPQPAPVADKPVVKPVAPAPQPPQAEPARPADRVVTSTDARTPPRPAEAPKPAPKEPAKEPVKEAAKEPAQTAAKEAPKDTKDTAADSGRYVVQVGAFAEAESARTARRKVEALGLKTYTQEVDTAGGKRIRVRVGPYSGRADAQKAAERIKASGLPAAVLTL